MSSKTIKQKNYFGAVMACKKDKTKCSPNTKKTATSMTKKQIKDFLKVKK